MGFPGGLVVKNLSACQSRRCRLDSWVRKIPWRRKWRNSPVFLLEKFHRQRSLASYSSWGHKESATTEQLSTHAQTYNPLNKGRAYSLEK